MNTNKLMAKIVEKGTNVENLAKVMGINKSTFYKKLDRQYHADFYRREIRAIQDELGLTDEEVHAIFFAQ